MKASRGLRWAGVVAAVLVWAGAARGAAAQKVASVEGITEYRLGNGARVLLYPDPTRPMVTTNLTVFVGSRMEGYGETGMAHLLEHMLFKGTKEFPNPKKEMESKGARWNGTTWVDRTNYFETMVSSDENLEFGIKFEADRLVNCPIRAEDLASEMTVVRNEFEMGENSPGNVLSERVMHAMYEWHNYGKSTIGNRTDIERVPADRLRAFYKKFYRPDNAMLIVAGKFDEGKALAWAEKYLGAVERPAGRIEETYTEEPPQDGERTVTLRRVGEVGIVDLAYHVPSGADPEFAAVNVLVDALTDSPTGELYKALVETKKASGVGGYAAALHDPGYMEMSADVGKGQSIDEVKAIMLGVIDRVAEDGVSDEQVMRAKRRFVAGRKRQLVDTARVAVGLSDWAAQGDWRLFFLFRDRMEAVTAADVKAVAGKYLRASNRTVGLFEPTTQPERTPVPAPPDVVAMVKDYKGRAAVAAGEQLDPDPLKIEARVKYPGNVEGVKVALLPKKTRQEMVTLRLTLRFGTAENLKGMQAVAEVLPDLMGRGTKKYPRKELHDALEECEATLGAGYDGTAAATFSLTAPRPKLAAAMELLRQVVREPRLDADEMEVLRQERLARLEEAGKDPQALARTALWRKMAPYEKGDIRYERTIPEQIADAKAVSITQVRAMYDQYLGAAAGELVVVGDFDEGEVMAVVHRMLDGWTAPKPQARVEVAGKNGGGGAEDVIPTPDKENAVYLAGTVLAMNDSDPDFPAVRMAAYALGGGASGRLWTRVRENEGLSYGAYASVNAGSIDKFAPVMVNAIYNPGNAAKVRTAIKEEVTSLAEKGVSDDEVKRNADAFLQERVMARSQERMLVTVLARNLYAGRTLKYDADMDAAVRKLTAAQVSAAAKKYLEPAEFWVVTAGDFNKGKGGTATRAAGKAE